MDENQKAFIRRHIRALIDKGYAVDEALADSLSILKDEQRSNEILKYFKQNASLTQTLQHFSIVQVEQNLLDALINLEKRSSKQHSSFQNLLQTDETISSILALFKAKLSVGLGYAVWLSVLATLVFSIIQIKVLPQFEDLFSGFGAELPALTKTALALQDSLISPTLIGVLLAISIGYLLSVLRVIPMNQLLDGKSLNARLIKLFPFVRSVFNYLQSMRWLSGLNTLTAGGLSLEESKNLLPNLSNSLENYLPGFENSLSTSAKIEGLTTEIQYQQNQLELIAESMVTKATAKLTASVMVFVVGYIAFTLIASYLPIFQLGAVV
jgi:type IV pilus assembly protein PilC